MGFLDKKERILDIVLTDKGRELLSKNQLMFAYYAFSDDGVDYSGSLNTARNLSGSTLDDVVYKNFLATEATSIKTDKKDLKYFLYTSNDANTVPEFQISVNLSSSLQLERRFFNGEVLNDPSVVAQIEEPEDVIVRMDIPAPTEASRQKLYVVQQKTAFLKGLLKK